MTGDSQPYTATAEYWDGTAVDVTTAGTWHSDTPSVATISSSGVATAHAAGTVHITAVFRDVASNAVTLDVVSGVTTALELNVRENKFYNEAAARTNPFVALKTFSDGFPAVDVSDQVTWLVDNPFVAWVNASGLFLTSSPGQATLQATEGALQSNEVPVEVANHLTFTIPLPETVDRHFNQSVDFLVQMAGGFEPLTYLWYKEDGSKTLIPIGTNSPQLSMQNLSASDAGTYQVQVMDANTDIQTDSTNLAVTQGVPASGVVGLAALLALIAIAGSKKMRRK